jgi:SRSO17 transposase
VVDDEGLGPIAGRAAGPHGTLARRRDVNPKHGDHSVAVARQYCGALGKIANCQVAVSTALLAEHQAWPTTMELYLPEEWAEDADRRARAAISRSLPFRPKWRIALTHVRQVRASGLQIDGVLADAA